MTKRKRSIKLAAAAASAVASANGVSSETAEEMDSEAVGVAVRLRKQKKRRKSDGVDDGRDDGEVEAAAARVEEGGTEENEKKNKKRKKEKNSGILTAAATAREESVLDNTERKESLPVSKKDKKKEKKKRKAEQAENVATAAPSTSGGGGADEQTAASTSLFGNGDTATINGSREKVDDVANATEISEKGLSVREKKGKGKKGQRDRWGQKISEHQQHNVERSGPQAAAAQIQPRRSGSSEDVYEPRKVFVGGMPYYITEDDIHDYFSECGEISELDCMTFPDSGNFCGIVFITFATEEGATKSLEYDGADMGGRFLKIERCKLKPRANGRNPDRGDVKKTPGLLSAYIGNLPWNVGEESIKNFLKKSYSASNVVAIRLSCDKETGEFKGFGHIDFGDDKSLEAAVKLNQTPLLGRPVKIAYAVARKQEARNGNDETKEIGLRGCYNCGEEGHKSYLCPLKGAGGNRKPESVKIGACYSCGEHGHKSFACPKKSSE